MQHRKHNPKHSNQIRITGGSLRGRKLSFQAADGLRPTPDSMRERLFNWLGQDLTGLDVLDLFAGSGALGFEAVSRCAARALLCDNNRQTVRQLHWQADALGITRKVEVVCTDSLRFLETNRTGFDVVFLDPPFAWSSWPVLFANLKGSLKTDARVYIEAADLPQWPQWLVPHREARAGVGRAMLLDYVQNAATE